MRTSLLFVAVAASALFLTAPADAQTRVARPRTVAVPRPVVVSRRTVFVGGYYYYPTAYRSSLWYDPWDPGFYGYYGYRRPSYQIQIPIYGRGRGYYNQGGSIRVQVSPRQAEVFIDGYFAGTVDDFDGAFQRLDVAGGEHEIQIYLAGYRTFVQRFYVQPGKTFNIRHTLEPLGPDDPTPPRPDVAPGPASGPGPYGVDGGRGGRGPGPDRRPGRGEGAGRGRQGGAPEGFGSLSLRVQPADAEVRIDGELWQGLPGSEPLVIQLGAGTHHIEIRKEGYRSYLTDIPLGSGQARTLNVSLTRQ